MKLAAIMMVRNEAAIIADSLGHLLTDLAMDRVYIADNGSADATPQILQRIAAFDPRVRVRSEPGAFRQPEVMRGLTEAAVADGMDWILPTDADEFLWLSAAALRACCAAAGAAAGFRLSVSNFAQLGGVAHDRPGSIETMAFRARPQGGILDGVGLVRDSALPFLRVNYPPKLLLRATASVALRRGQHDADGLDGELAPHPAAEVLHAPIRSRDDLDSRVAHGRRMAEVAPEPDTGWHLKRLVGMDGAALDAEWRANSVRPGWRLTPGFQFDPRLCWLGRRLRRFRDRALAVQRGRQSDAAPACSSATASAVHHSTV